MITLESEALAAAKIDPDQMSVVFGSAPSVPPTPGQMLFVDGEAMIVDNVAADLVTVHLSRRGVTGTRQIDHEVSQTAYWGDRHYFAGFNPRGEEAQPATPHINLNNNTIWTIQSGVWALL